MFNLWSLAVFFDLPPAVCLTIFTITALFCIKLSMNLSVPQRCFDVFDNKVPIDQRIKGFIFMENVFAKKRRNEVIGPRDA